MLPLTTRFVYENGFELMQHTVASFEHNCIFDVKQPRQFESLSSSSRTLLNTIVILGELISWLIWLVHQPSRIAKWTNCVGAMTEEDASTSMGGRQRTLMTDGAKPQLAEYGKWVRNVRNQSKRKLITNQRPSFLQRCGGNGVQPGMSCSTHTASLNTKASSFPVASHVWRYHHFLSFTQRRCTAATGTPHSDTVLLGLQR